MAGHAEMGLFPQGREPLPGSTDAPGAQKAVGRVIAQHDLALQIDQRRVGDAAAGLAADRHGAVVLAVVQRDAQQAVGRGHHPSAMHIDAVAMASVVHKPGVVAVDHHVPAVALAGGADVVPAPIAIHAQGLRRFVPVVAKYRAHADHIDGITDRTEARDRRLGAVKRCAHGSQALRV